MIKIRIWWKSINRDIKLSIGFSIFWYVALFPGRLGFDYSLAIRMIHHKQSTDQWTSLYFWIFRLTTINGRTIALISLISLITLMASIKYFISSLPFSESVRNRTYLYTSALPLVGAFGVNVSHDVFLAAGILLLISINLRNFERERLPFKHFILIELLINGLLLTTVEGFIVALVNLILLIFQRRIFAAGVILSAVVLLQFLSGAGITKNPPSVKAAVFIDDLKCVTQHPQARISSEEWKYLISLAPKDEWLNPVSCSWPDDMYSSLPSLNKEKAVLNSTFLKNYLKIFLNNPLIVVESHLQRSRGSLPPPFFQGPDNQVSLDNNLPVGYKTNIALQSGPEILHPSIDEPSVKVHLSFLKPLEFIAQASMFFFNQSSWFWGWGALWLWPVFLFVLIKIAKGKVSSTVRLLLPVITLHLTLVLFGPSPLPRYVISATYLGVIITIGVLVEYSRRLLHNDDQ